MPQPSVLGVALLRLLASEAMHPYEMRRRLREEGLDTIIKVTHGALYNTVGSLTQAGLVEPVETTREGKRPERTVYSITPAGRDVVIDRVQELLGSLQSEYPTYCAALAFMSLLPPERAADQLDRRGVLLETELAAATTSYDALIKRGRHAVDLVELRHIQSHLRADLELTHQLMDDIRSGRLTWSPKTGRPEESR